MNHYHNTLPVTGELLIRFEEKAFKQDQIVLEVFRVTKSALTPFDVLKELSKRGYNYPITSVRRAITNLTKEGKLVKTEVQKKGMYNAPNNTWRLA